MQKKICLIVIHTKRTVWKSLSDKSNQYNHPTLIVGKPWYAKGDNFDANQNYNSSNQDSSKGQMLSINRRDVLQTNFVAHIIQQRMD